ncbi:hypothetical protein LTR50_007594 [Elasticomyces elasticus]|nr:hypothetical protein LTR50_007594 [Elasticomyces elasticus]
MNAAPPSYGEATSINYWNLVALYIPSSDLCSVALVSKEWHTIFAPHLWGNPASHFGIENDAVYVALTRFKRALPRARYSVRSLTHTLHLPPAHAEIYDGPHADWLRDVLQRLPCLQSLIVRGLAFFDHASLIALKYSTGASSNQAERAPRPGTVELPARFEGDLSLLRSLDGTTWIFGLRLLDASRCTNVTAIGLCQALRRFEALIYLDLSYTPPARDASVLATLHSLHGLQVLRLKGLHLRDSDVALLAPAIRRKCRSLDLRGNNLTDVSVRSLLEHCFLSREEMHQAGPGRTQSRSPALLPYLGADMLRVYQGKCFESFLRHTVTSGFINRLAIEDAPEGGITHLYVANNQISVEGVSGLLRSGRLHVLDVGSPLENLVRCHSTSTNGQEQHDIHLPGVEKLVPVLVEHASTALTFLRINHGLLTKAVLNAHEFETVPGRSELSEQCLPIIPTNMAELSGNTPVFELAADERISELSAEETPRYELPGDPIHMVLSPAIGEPPVMTTKEEETWAQARRGSASAPEVFESLQESSLLDPGSAWGSFPSPTVSTQSGSSPLDGVSRLRSYSSVVAARHARLYSRAHDVSGLDPAMLPHVSTLVLTDVPPTSALQDLTQRLIKFIKNCAAETHLARLQAQLDYTLPPGHCGKSSDLRARTQKIFALREITLEMSPEKPVQVNRKASAWRLDSTRSMTEDRDSEALWSAAQEDFSFFSEGEECGLPSLEPTSSPSTNRDRHNSQSGSAVDGITRRLSEASEEPQYHTITLLAAFRKAKKAEYVSKLTAGDIEPRVDGYWEGNVKVIWPRDGTGSGWDSDEEHDWYGK